MESTTVILDTLQSERQSLANAGRLHWVHWFIVIASALLTIAAWYFSKSQVDENSRTQFEREAAQVVELVRERMLRYEDALLSGVAAIEASGGDMSHAEWQTFAVSLHIETKYPGINGIGVIKSFSSDELPAHIAEQGKTRPGYRVHPAHAGEHSMPIVYIEPELPNARAVGLDMAHENNRYTAAINARDSAKSQITGPIVLVQDDEKTPGFLFFAPYYRNNLAGSVNERRKNFIGIVYAPFVVKKLIAGTLQQARRRVGFSLSDAGSVLYDENTPDDGDFDRDPMYQKKSQLELYGRTWDFDIRSTSEFRRSTANNQPIFILVGGITIDAMLLTMFLMLTRVSRKTLSFADRMNVELRQKAVALAQSNAELESFAYVASHDLKTPLRGIIDLSEYLEEDLEDYLSGPDSKADVGKNLLRLRQQTSRMDNLINGILSYSRVGSRPEQPESVDLEMLLRSIATELNIRGDQLKVAGSLPDLVTYRVRFEQVLNNLIGNAVKYNPDRKSATVTVRCRPNGRFYEFSVSDNGPGIDPKFHSRIFEVFQTLQTKDEIESTGVGLAIVKKSVEALGGQIRVTSELGEGTTFLFDWPVDVPVPGSMAREVC